MIPILYETTETQFASNGLARLRDVTSCVVTEERNGIYECDFSIPVDGAFFDQIQYGRIIAVEHDDSGDIQPFDIVSSTKPINGVVNFHAVHISYRQSKLVTYGWDVNNMAEAVGMLRRAMPENPFTYGYDLVGSAYMAAADGIPRTVKSLLGGVEGSILDTFGGEYEWDKFNVYLHSSRGEYTGYTIRYGVNLLTYNDETDYSETYSSIVPYWTGVDENQEQIVVVGNRRGYGHSTITGRGETIPVDFTDKFETQPSLVDLELQADMYLKSHQPIIPNRNISISFAQLKDIDEYENYAGLLNCKLCDSVRVVFPTYNMDGYFKIVKTEWDVLAERYKSMELGALPTTLSQALGLSK